MLLSQLLFPLPLPSSVILTVAAAELLIALKPWELVEMIIGCAPESSCKARFRIGSRAG